MEEVPLPKKTYAEALDWLHARARERRKVKALQEVERERKYQERWAAQKLKNQQERE